MKLPSSPRGLLGSVLALGFLLGPGPAVADFPQVTWDPVNPPVPVHTAGPLARTWDWECDDPSDDFPLSLRCRTYDLTLGGVGSGQEVLLGDVDCGTFVSDPAPVTFGYDVAAPVSDRKYAYGARCQDGIGFSFFRHFFFWYDVGAPVPAITAGPPASSEATTAQLSITCDDTSYDYDFSPSAYQAPCGLSCALFDAVTNDELVAPGPCDTPLVTDEVTVASHEFSGLAPGSYRAEVVGTDGAGNASPAATHEWEVTAASVPSLALWGQAASALLLVSASLWMLRERLSGSVVACRGARADRPIRAESP
jgi:hypothetical protein